MGNGGDELRIGSPCELFPLELVHDGQAHSVHILCQVADFVFGGGGDFQGQVSFAHLPDLLSQAADGGGDLAVIQQHQRQEYDAAGCQ